MAKALTVITNRAKAIRKANPRITWQTAVKKAGAEYRSGKKMAPARKKVGAFKVVEKGEPRSAKATKVYRIDRTKKGLFKGYSVAGLRAELKKKLAADIGILEARKLDARTKRDRAAIQKLITSAKREYRKLA